MAARIVVLWRELLVRLPCFGEDCGCWESISVERTSSRTLSLFEWELWLLVPECKTVCGCIRCNLPTCYCVG